MSAIGGLVGAALTTGAGIASNVIDRNKTFEQNKELAALQNQYNIDQWNRENVYNNPTSQKARLAAAGFNTNMIGGAGANTSAQLSGKLSAGSPKDRIDYTQSTVNLANMINQNKLLSAQVENVKADTSLKENQSNKAQSESNYTQLMAKWYPTLAMAKFNLDDESARKLALESEQIDAILLEYFGTHLSFQSVDAGNGCTQSIPVGSIDVYVEGGTLYHREAQARVENAEATAVYSQIKNKISATQLRYLDDFLQGRNNQLHLGNIVLEKQGESITMDVDLQKDLQTSERYLGLAGQVLKIIGSFVK